jgi:hypothetical protein
MYIFAEPVTEEQADKIQDSKLPAQRAFARDIVGIDQNDPEVQKEWQDIQDRVDSEVGEDEIREVEKAEGVDENEDLDETIEVKIEEVDEISEARKKEGPLNEEADVVDQIQRKERSEEEEDNESSKVEKNGEVDEMEHGEAALAENDDTAETTDVIEEVEEEHASALASKPLIGWTLAVRSRVNGIYVERPVDLSPEDNWTVEYHIKEIDPDARWNLYKKIKEERRNNIGQSDEERSAGLERYRSIIRKYSTSGRRWREEQDEVDEQTTKQMFRPMGPGSEG